jgi:hypothetical protein
MAAQFPYAPNTPIFITNWNGRVIYSGPESQCPQRYLKMLPKVLPESLSGAGRVLAVTETGGASATYLGLIGAL